jgi:hypothetical protein
MLAGAGGATAFDVIRIANAKPEWENSDITAFNIRYLRAYGIEGSPLTYPWLIKNKFNPVYNKPLETYGILTDAVANHNFKRIAETVYRLKGEPLVNGEQMVEALQEWGIIAPPGFAESVQARAGEELGATFNQDAIAIINSVCESDDTWTRQDLERLRRAMRGRGVVDFKVARGYGLNIFPLLVKVPGNIMINNVYEPVL